MKRVEASSYPVSIFIAGDRAKACEHCRYLADWWGMCVTVSATDYVFTGGEEPGLVIGLINYPRFPASPKFIWERAEEVAASLCSHLGQQSYTIQAPDKTVWFSHRVEDQPTHPGEAL